jgi:hypothetical protein
MAYPVHVLKNEYDLVETPETIFTDRVPHWKGWEYEIDGEWCVYTFTRPPLDILVRLGRREVERLVDALCHKKRQAKPGQRNVFGTHYAHRLAIWIRYIRAGIHQTKRWLGKMPPAQVGDQIRNTREVDELGVEMFYRITPEMVKSIGRRILSECKWSPAPWLEYYIWSRLLDRSYYPNNNHNRLVRANKARNEFGTGVHRLWAKIDLERYAAKTGDFHVKLFLRKWGNHLGRVRGCELNSEIMAPREMRRLGMFTTPEGKGALRALQHERLEADPQHQLEVAKSHPQFAEAARMYKQLFGRYRYLFKGYRTPSLITHYCLAKSPDEVPAPHMWHEIQRKRGPLPPWVHSDINPRWTCWRDFARSFEGRADARQPQNLQALCSEVYRSGLADDFIQDAPKRFKKAMKAYSLARKLGALIPATEMPPLPRESAAGDTRLFKSIGNYILKSHILQARWKGDYRLFPPFLIIKSLKNELVLSVGKSTFQHVGQDHAQLAEFRKWLETHSFPATGTLAPRTKLYKPRARAGDVIRAVRRAAREIATRVEMSVPPELVSKYVSDGKRAAKIVNAANVYAKMIKRSPIKLADPVALAREVHMPPESEFVRECVLRINNRHDWLRAKVREVLGDDAPDVVEEIKTCLRHARKPHPETFMGEAGGPSTNLQPVSKSLKHPADEDATRTIQWLFSQALIVRQTPFEPAPAAYAAAIEVFKQCKFHLYREYATWMSGAPVPTLLGQCVDLGDMCEDFWMAVDRLADGQADIGRDILQRISNLQYKHDMLVRRASKLNQKTQTRLARPRELELKTGEPQQNVRRHRAARRYNRIIEKN